jgi:kynurenine formamidase
VRDVPLYADLLERTDAPAGSSWGVFGREEDHGTLNFVSPDCVLDAAACVRRGAVFTLDYPLDYFDGLVELRKTARHTIVDMSLAPGGAPSGTLDDVLDDFYPQKSTHLDALRHAVDVERGGYNGVPIEELVPGKPRLGIGSWAERGIVGRGVLLDVARLREQRGEPLEHLASEPIPPSLLDETAAAQRVELRPGDMLLLRTAYPQYAASRVGDVTTALRSSGIEVSREMVAWLWDHQVSLIASDNLGVEPTPVRRADAWPGPNGLHQQLVGLLGMPFGELFRLDDLATDCATDSRYEFMIVVKPLNLTGGCGSPANATAIK